MAGVLCRGKRWSASHGEARLSSPGYACPCLVGDLTARSSKSWQSGQVLFRMVTPVSAVCSESWQPWRGAPRTRASKRVLAPSSGAVLMWAGQDGIRLVRQPRRGNTWMGEF